MTKNVKFVIIGDGSVGKTCLLCAYTQGTYDPSYTPTVFDNYVVKLTVNGVDINLQLWDTAGQEDLENIRVLSYNDTDVYLVCFSLDQPSSMQNVKLKWMKELSMYVRNPTILLIGTKKDLRDDAPTNKEGLISKEQGENLSNDLKASGYMECSAKKMEGVTELFKEALTIALKKSQKKRKCILI